MIKEYSKRRYLMSKVKLTTIKDTRTGRELAVEDLAQTFEYEAGIKITSYNQYVRDGEGQLWQVNGSRELPYTTTGAGMPEGGAAARLSQP